MISEIMGISVFYSRVWHYLLCVRMDQRRDCLQ